MKLLLADSVGLGTLLWMVLSSFAPSKAQDVCPNEFKDYDNCTLNMLSSEAEREECENCRGDILNTILTQDGCDDALCATAANCPCGECTETMQNFLTCEASNQTNCDISCLLDNCESVRVDYRNCVFRLDTGKACDDCRAQTRAQFRNSGGTCDLANSTFCESIQGSCREPCANCIDELEELFACTVGLQTNGACQIGCGSDVSPENNSDKPLCDEYTEYANCLLSELPIEQGMECDSCRLEVDRQIDGGGCEEQEQAIQIAIDSGCDCGSCQGRLAAYFVCSVSKRSFGECLVEVPTQPPSTKVPANSTAPAPMPSVSDSNNPDNTTVKAPVPSPTVVTDKGTMPTLAPETATRNINGTVFPTVAIPSGAVSYWVTDLFNVVLSITYLLL